MVQRFGVDVAWWVVQRWGVAWWVVQRSGVDGRVMGGSVGRAEACSDGRAGASSGVGDFGV